MLQDQSQLTLLARKLNILCDNREPFIVSSSKTNVTCASCSKHISAKLCLRLLLHLCHRLELAKHHLANCIRCISVSSAAIIFFFGRVSDLEAVISSFLAGSYDLKICPSCSLHLHYLMQKWSGRRAGQGPC